MSYQLEACVTNLEQALLAESRGAHRVELCVNLETGGMTPGFALAKNVCEQVQIPIRIMIRETAVGFEADEETMSGMIESIEILKALNPDGFVFGVMKHHRINRDVMQVLLQHAYPKPVTLHKAMDQSYDLANDLGWLNQFPQIDTILTSGGAERALDGMERILWMKNIFKGKLMADRKSVV